MLRPVTCLCSWVHARRRAKGQAAEPGLLEATACFHRCCSAWLAAAAAHSCPGGWRGAGECFPGTPFLQAQFGGQLGLPPAAPGCPGQGRAPHTLARLWGISCSVATSAAGPGSCPRGFIPALAGRRASEGLPAFPSPAGRREPAHGSSQLPTPYISKLFPIPWPVKLLPVGSPACTASLWRSKANTSVQRRRRAAGLRAEPPTVCRKALRWSCSQWLPGRPGAPGTRGCPPRQAAGLEQGAALGRGAAAAQRGREAAGGIICSTGIAKGQSLEPLINRHSHSIKVQVCTKQSRNFFPWLWGSGSCWGFRSPGDNTGGCPLSPTRPHQL